MPAGHRAWALEADYLALGLVSIIGVLSPRRIVVGGGVLAHRPLLPRIRRRVVELLAGYVDAPELASDADTYIVPPALGDDAGVFGALALAQTTLAGRRSESSRAE